MLRNPRFFLADVPAHILVPDELVLISKFYCDAGGMFVIFELDGNFSL